MKLRSTIKRAASIIVDSKYGKNNLIQKYNVESNRISVIPFEPLNDINQEKFEENELINTFNKYNITDKYIFYPAQFFSIKTIYTS